MKVKGKTHKSIIALLLLAAFLTSCDWEKYDPARYKKQQDSEDSQGSQNTPDSQGEKENWYYYLDVKEIPIFPSSGGTGSFTVQSYKKDGKGNAVKVSWTIEPLSSIPAWLEINIVEGEDMADVIDIKVAAQSSGASSGVNDYDLSTNGGSSEKTTANCYIVSRPGTYRLPLVYGNAIKNGKVNTKAYNPEGTGSDSFLKPFLNHDGNGITDPWLKNNGAAPDGATLVWEDSRGLVKDVGISGDYLTFNIPQDAVEGNAVLAATQNGTVVWSWHIWLTGEDMSRIVTVDTPGGAYSVTPMNLGHFTEGKKLQGRASARQCFFIIRQTEQGGLQKDQTVRQSGTDSSVSSDLSTDKTSCTFYQWGRKDAFPPAATENQKFRTCYTGDGNVLTVKAGPCLNIGWTIKNPVRFLVNGTNRGPYGPHGSAQHNVWHPDYKTIYDPCPPGYRVAPYAVFKAMAEGGRNDAKSDERGHTWSNGTETLFMPKTGFLQMQDGRPWYVGQQGWYWPADCDNDSHAHCIEIGKLAIMQVSSPKATGYAVRPIIDK